MTGTFATFGQENALGEGWSTGARSQLSRHLGW